ncbi:MAG: cobyric acid synthase CobQ [Candidatus Parabeggiatoa sp. nov. 1]|nr:MAG: cobyric acid synthase CobQ [Gammaproteobacteria bacterium]
MKSLSVFGTSSDAGKTTLVMALCRIFVEQGYRVAPFKAQNVSNNSAVSDDGSEISRAQFFQAEAAKIPTSYHLNPVLLKSQGNGSVQVIVNGKIYKSQGVKDYYQEIDTLKIQVQAAFEHLVKHYDFVIAEGAGSPVELNLLHKDLSNTFIAQTFNTKTLLVADIERGGVFASVYGTVDLLESQLRENFIGVIINKFRGDMRFFEQGRKIIEQRFQIPVLGVVPFQPLNINMEDSYSLQNYQQRLGDEKLSVVVIACPGISNYDDLDPLMADEEIRIEIIQTYQSLSAFDVVLLVGSKTTIRDLQWLKANGLFAEILRFQGHIFGICGGYQMLFSRLDDRNAYEYQTPIQETGLGLIADTVTFHGDKILKRGQYQAFGQTVSGYEIHLASAGKYPLFYEKGRIAGTHLHGIFDNDEFRTAWFRKICPRYKGYTYQAYRETQLQTYVEMIKTYVDYETILTALKE